MNDDPRVAEGIILHVIGSSDTTAVRLPPCGIRFVKEVFTATTSGGLMCVLAQSEHGELAAAVVDLDQPEATQFRTITAGNDRARICNVVHAEDRFAIAWVSSADAERRSPAAPLR